MSLFSYSSKCAELEKQNRMTWRSRKNIADGEEDEKKTRMSKRRRKSMKTRRTIEISPANPRMLPNCVKLSPSLECRQDKVDNGDRYTLTEHSCWMLFLQLVLSLSLSSSTRIIEPGILSFD